MWGIRTTWHFGPVTVTSESHYLYLTHCSWFKGKSLFQTPSTAPWSLIQVTVLRASPAASCKTRNSKRLRKHNL
ncbi:hypothetical protein WG66_014444 [Moniliophthora roreri]|nr:hypothetical protein WG66_014444 [Moniliophthora roreri]